MTINEIKNLLQSPAYDFLRKDPHLGKNVILLGLGGSHAYGTNTETSDVDIRGIALNSKEELLTNVGFEQFVNEETDTTIYAFNKMISLLSNVNPNTIEIVGLKPEHYLYISQVGQELINHKNMFLSTRCVQTFGGYATAQLRRLQSKAAREIGQAEREQYIMNSITFADESFRSHHAQMPEDGFKLYIDKSEKEDYDTEIFADVHLKHYPLRDLHGIIGEYSNVINMYDKVGKRNQHAMVHEKIGKHMCHLIRLYYMCFDILEKGEIITYRENEHDLLMSIRNGEWLDENKQPIQDFYKLVDDLEKRMQKDREQTKLPQKPDYAAINRFMISVNERIVNGSLPV